MNSTGERRPFLRLRTGFVVVVALGLISAIAGRWTATLFSLGWGGASVIGLLVAVLVVMVLAWLDRRAYAAVAVLVTLVVAFSAYDFVRGPADWSPGAAFALALVPTVLLGLAFWDFRHLTDEFSAWLERRRQM